MKRKKIPHRDPIARDLLTPKYRQRVVPNKKRALKTGTASKTGRNLLEFTDLTD